MNIRILHMAAGARQATGLTVIIDVFRAFSVETFLMRNNAQRIIPVGDIQTAFDYKAAHPDAILCGERGGIIIDGFDYGNSPAQLEHVDMTGKTVVHTTSAGTQGIANAIHADEIIGGSLLSARAIAKYIKQQNPKEVSLVCMGLMAERQSEEDNLCAEYIKCLLEDRPFPDLDARIEGLKTTSGAKFFDPAQQHVFPERDFHLCTQVNCIPFILRLTQDRSGGLPYMERVDVMGASQDELYCHTTEITQVHPGDTMSMFTLEQVLLFPNEVKTRIVYNNLELLNAAADCALVLGGPASLIESRATAAAELYHAGQAPLLLVTGGVYRDTRTEAQILADYLLDLRVPQAQILIEDRAANTIENMQFCQKLLEERFSGKSLRIAVVTSSFHRYRATVLAQSFFPNHTVQGVGAELPLDNAAEYLQDPVMRKRINTECRCLWKYVQEGLIPDFPVR